MSAFDAKGGPSAHGQIKNRWMAVTAVPVDGVYWLLWVDGLENESLSGATDIPTYAIDHATAGSDSAVRKPLSYLANVYFGTPLKGDNVAPSSRPYLFRKIYGTEELVVVPPEISKDPDAKVYDDRVVPFVGMLNRLRGIPLNIYSPKFGTLLSFALASFDASGNNSTRTPIALSFQQVLVSRSQRVVVPVIARAGNMAHPLDPGKAGNPQKGGPASVKDISILYSEQAPGGSGGITVITGHAPVKSPFSTVYSAPGIR